MKKDMEFMNRFYMIWLAFSPSLNDPTWGSRIFSSYIKNPKGVGSFDNTSVLIHLSPETLNISSDYQNTHLLFIVNYYIQYILILLIQWNRYSNYK